MISKILGIFNPKIAKGFPLWPVFFSWDETPPPGPGYYIYRSCCGREGGGKGYVGPCQGCNYCSYFSILVDAGNYKMGELFECQNLRVVFFGVHQPRTWLHWNERADYAGLFNYNVEIPSKKMFRNPSRSICGLGWLLMRIIGDWIIQFGYDEGLGHASDLSQ